MLFESAASAFIFQINIMDTLPAGSGSAATPPRPAWLISLAQPHRTHKNTKATPVWALTADTKCKKATHFRVGGIARVARLPLDCQAAIPVLFVFHSMHSLSAAAATYRSRCAVTH